MPIDLLIVFLALPIGIFAGMMPGVPTSVVLLLSFPLIYVLPFNLLIGFYIAVAICTQFSNSVIAIYAGVPGDLTALPVIKERNNLLKHFSIKENLTRTAFASSFGTIIGFCLLGLFVYFLSPYSVFLLRTEVLFSIIAIVLFVCLFWRKNNLLINAALLIIGLFIGIIGFNNLLLKDFFTFGIPILYGGIPIFPAFVALYAFPNLLRLNNDKKSFILDDTPKNIISENKITSSSILGSLIGSGMGLVPLLGTYSSSNVAYWIGNALKLNSLEKIAASESSNSAAFVIVLVPLLVFGIAIVPSEAILLELLLSKGWSIEFVTPKTLYTLLGVTILSIFFGYYTCTKFAKYMVLCIMKSGKWITWIIFLTLLLNIYMIASYTNEIEIYLIVFFVCIALSTVLEKLEIDPIPLIFSWALGEQTIASGYTILNLYF